MLKVAVIGGGSTYTPELVSGFLDRLEQFPLDELWLMDIDARRLEIVGGFAQRMVANRGKPFQVFLTTRQTEAVAGANYVTTQIRVGQMEARRQDEYLGLRHGLVGQETTGVGGMAKALRTIPVILKVAEDMRTLAHPGALLVNFTNPAGLVTQALSQYAPDVPSVGVCNGPLTTKIDFLEMLAAPGEAPTPHEQVEVDTLGLNHLTWYRGLKVNGVETWPRLLEVVLAELRAMPNPPWDPQTIAALGMIPNDYIQYFYYTARKLEAQRKWPPSRAEQVMAIEEKLLQEYANPALVTPPPELMQRGGAYYATVAAQLLNAHYNDLDEIHVVNLRQGGAVAGWPADWVLEMPARVGRAGLVPLPAEPLPPAQFGLLAAVKAYELLTVQAAVHGDRKAAYQALLVHPLGPSAEKIQAVLDDLLAVHRPYLPQFTP